MTTISISIAGSVPTNVTLKQIPGLHYPVPKGVVVATVSFDRTDVLRGIALDGPDAGKFGISGTFPLYKIVAAVTLPNPSYSVGVAYLPTGSTLKLAFSPPVVVPPVDPPPVGTDDDGHTNAPAGAAQYPRLLDGYKARPAWQVAGVDYAVGVHPGVALKVPTAGNLPAGAGLGSHVINVTGNNVTLRGYDLTGYTVMIMDAARGTVTITDCIATSSVNIRSTVGATAGLVVTYCTLDGGGTLSDPDFQTVKVWTPLTVEYCLIKNSPVATYSGAPTTIKYNAMSGFTWVPVAHSNAIYIFGGNDPSETTTIAYNTIWSGDTRNAQGFPVGLGAAIAFFADGGNFYNTTVANNTIVSELPGGASYLIGYYVGSGESATGGVVSDNYVASINGFNNNGSGAFGVFYTGSTGTVQATYTGNIDMSTGTSVG